MKVGDKVLFSAGSGFNHRYEIATIAAETKTQWLVRGYRFRKSDLRCVGNRWRFRIEELTDEARQRFDEKEYEQAHNSLWRNIQGIKRPHHLTVARLQEIYDELKGKE